MKAGAPIRVVVADDHRIFREGLCALLARSAAVKVVGNASDGEEAILVTREKQPDVLLLDLDMPVLDGIAVTRILSAHSRHPKILILSVYEDEARVRMALQVGAAGYVAKRVDTQELIEILKSTVAGEVRLSPFLPHLALIGKDPQQALPRTPVQLTAKERETLAFLARGYSNHEIARAAHMSCDTVKAYLKTIFAKLDVRNRTQAAVVALQLGLVAQRGHDDPVVPGALRGDRAS